MKNKLITICVLTAFILAFSSPAKATVTAVDLVDSTGQADPPTSTYFFPYADNDDRRDDAPWYRWLDQDWGWTHTYSPPGPIPASIISATLDIRAWDVDSTLEVDVIFGGGQGGTNLGSLVGANEAWSTTSFTIPDGLYTDLMDGNINIWMDIDSTGEVRGWAVTLDWSKLTVEYNPIIPAPGAILLGSIGVGLVGWLRRRRTL